MAITELDVGVLPWCFDQRALVTIVERDSRETRSVEELLADGLRIAGGLAEREIGPAARIGIYAETSFDLLRGCFGIWASGNTVVTLPPLDNREKPPVPPTHSVPVDLIVTAATQQDSKRSVAIGELMRAEPFDGASPEPSSPALIQHSSGTTGPARGVLLSHGALSRYMTLMADHLRDPDRSLPRYVSWLPLQHDLGFVHYLLFPLSVGASISLMSPQTFLRDPIRWIEEMDRTRGQKTSGPNFAYGLVARRLENRQGRPFDLSDWTLAGCGGEPINPQVLERFIQAAASHGFDRSAIMPGYGLAEATCAVTMGPLEVDRIDREALEEGRAEPASGDGQSVAIASVGPPVAGNEIAIRDEEGRTLPERTLGSIYVRSPYLMSGYTDPDAPDPIDAEGWLHTGDRGYLANGNLYVTGRTKDLIISAGRNFHAEDIERLVTQIPGVRPGGCVAVGVTDEAGRNEHLVLLAEVEPTQEHEAGAIRTKVRRTVRSELGLLAQRVVLLPRGSLPKTSSGKLQRSLARRLYEKGELRP